MFFTLEAHHSDSESDSSDARGCAHFKLLCVPIVRNARTCMIARREQQRSDEETYLFLAFGAFGGWFATRPTGLQA